MDDLEEALNKQIEALRALLSSLVQEEKTYCREKKIGMNERLEMRLNLLESYENAEAKGVNLMERYLFEKRKPSLLKTGLKIEQLNEFKNALSIDELSISIRIGQLISLLEKIQETNDHLRMLDEQGQMKLYAIVEECPKKMKTQVGVIHP